MVSPSVEISELNYHVRRKRAELEHLDKYVMRRKKIGLLTDFDQKDVQEQQERILHEIQGLEKQIRRIENEQVRLQNMRA